jgi:hypothetical protein
MQGIALNIFNDLLYFINHVELFETDIKGGNEQIFVYSDF